MLAISSDDTAWKTITRSLAGQLSEEEGRELDRRLREDPEWQQLFEQLQTIWKQSPTSHSWNSASALAQIKVARVMRATPAPSRVSAWSNNWLRAAAAVVFAVGVGGIAWKVAHSRPELKHVATQLRVLKTKTGERATLTLADGTRIILGAASTLTYPEDFNLGARDVRLEGEAYFAVQHDQSRPFRVHTSAGITEDLGTEFVVNAYPENRSTQVAVQSGSVVLHQLSPSPTISPLATLERGDLAQFDSAGHAVVTRGVDISQYVAWTKGTLVFKNTSLQDAVIQLKRWYDIDIVIADSSLATRRITATIQDVPTTSVISLLEIGLNLRAEQHGRTVILHAKS